MRRPFAGMAVGKRNCSQVTVGNTECHGHSGKQFDSPLKPKLKVHLSFGPAITFSEIYLRETKPRFLRTFTEALFTRTPNSKQSKRPSEMDVGLTRLPRPVGQQAASGRTNSWAQTASRDLERVLPSGKARLGRSTMVSSHS